MIRILLIFLSCQLVYSQQKDSVSTLPPPPKTKKINWSGLVLPGRSPENGWYGQGGVILLFKTAPNDTIQRSSNVYLFGFYSQLHQLRISIGGDIFTRNEMYYLNAWYYYSHLPELFFGIGKSAVPDQSEFISYRVLHAQTTLYRKVFGHFFAGLHLHGERVFQLSSPISGLYEQNKFGSQDYSIVGTGPKLRLDTRDNVLSSSKGILAEVTLRSYGNILGSSYNFTVGEIDFRYFHPVILAKRHIWASQIYASAASGNIPFRNYPSILLRGYHPNLYRDKFVTWIQTEYRFAIWKFIGASIFGGLGQSAETGPDFANNPLKYSYGGGLRFRIVPKHNLNLRIEYGFGNGSSSFYVAFSDAF